MNESLLEDNLWHHSIWNIHKYVLFYNKHQCDCINQWEKKKDNLIHLRKKKHFLIPLVTGQRIRSMQSLILMRSLGNYVILHIHELEM